MNREFQSLVTGLLLLTPCLVPALAQMPAAAPGASGPIDIQANEQEFAPNQVIARGNVKVTYKDSIVFAPQAVLMKDGTGNPQKAIFTGHPHLLQGQNRIDAETLVFEMGSSKIVATGRAHSEVISEGSSTPPSAEAAPVQVLAANAKDDDAPADPDNDVKKKINPTAVQPKKTGKEPPEKIITDSDRQEYDRVTGRFDAFGHVHVVHGNILVKADKLQVVYGTDNKPETALFTGNVAATQDRNTTLADSMVYSLQTKRLQATGHVKSTVIQEKKEDKTKKTNVGFDVMPSANAAETVKKPMDDIVIITSDGQDYSKETGRMTAVGGVKVYYEDLVGVGPAAVLIRNDLGKAQRIVFSGRSQITQPGKRWIADHIEMTLSDKRVLASGNTRAVIIQTPKGAPKPPETQLAAKRPPGSIATRKDDSTQ